MELKSTTFLLLREECAMSIPAVAHLFSFSFSLLSSGNSHSGERIYEGNDSSSSTGGHSSEKEVRLDWN